LKNNDVIHDMDVLASKVSSRTKDLVDHSKADSSASVTKFDEMMARLKATAAATKQNIRTDDPSTSAPATSSEIPAADPTV
jgi:citrate synthase